MLKIGCLTILLFLVQSLYAHNPQVSTISIIQNEDKKLSNIHIIGKIIFSSSNLQFYVLDNEYLVKKIDRYLLKYIYC
jgi:hypothetical protein